MPNQDGFLYEFGPFRLSPAQGSLIRNGSRVHLAPKAFELLVFLIDKRCSTVSKQELLVGVWPGLYVGESNVERQISDLRKVLADQTGNYGYIRTFSKRGYQFVAPVMEILGQPMPDDGPQTTEDVLPHRSPGAKPNEAPLNSTLNPSGTLAKDSVGPFLSTMSCLIALIIALVLSQWGFAGTIAVLLFAASLIDYCRAPDGVGRRAWTAAMLILSGALLPSVVTYPELARGTVNFNAIPPSAVYPFVMGLKFVPLFIVTLGFWVFAIRFEGGPVGVVSTFRALYFGVGAAVLVLTVAILLDASADWRVVAAGITQAWLMLGGWTIVLALNVFILITGWIGFSRANKTDSTYAFSRCVQAWLRRSISTAYYALFHLLVGEAAQRWMGSPAERLGLERAFKHDQMKEVSRVVAAGSWKGWSTPRLPVPVDLRAVANSFVKLQEARHEADYGNEKSWTQSDVATNIREARITFQKWKGISGSAVADEYLLSLMIGKKRE